MVFRTELNLNNSSFNLGYKNQILFLGSCFSDHIGQKFKNLGFQCQVNPFGTAFNISSIRNNIDMSIQDNWPKEENLDFNQDLFSHRDFHSRFNAPVPYDVLKNIHQALINVKSFIKTADTFFITLGTAWVYKSKNDGHIVSNCHKLPSSKFDKILMSSSDIYNELSLLSLSLTSINPNIKMILTISPVRHLKDGIIENQVSKSRLINAVYDFCLDGKASYFPAYEFMLDDLRDYRFYDEDMIHPNQQAIDYIWENLSKYYFANDTLNVVQKIEKIHHFLHHRPIHQSLSYNEHKAKIKSDLYELQKDYGVDITDMLPMLS